MSTTWCEATNCTFRPRCATAAIAAFAPLGPRGSHASIAPPVPSGAPGACVPRKRDALQWIADHKLSTVALIAPARTDLGDCGTSVLLDWFSAIRRQSPGVIIELYISDYQYHGAALRELLRARPEVVHHALTTSPRVLPKVLPGASYTASLNMLRIASEEFESIRLRSTIALGHGETRDELIACVADLKSVRVDELLFIRPPAGTAKSVATPEFLARLRQIAEKLQFQRMEVLDAPRPCVAPDPDSTIRPS